MVVQFLLAVLCIAAGIFAIVIQTEWWVCLVFFGLALLCLVIGFFPKKVGNMRFFAP